MAFTAYLIDPERRKELGERFPPRSRVIAKQGTIVWPYPTGGR